MNMMYFRTVIERFAGCWLLMRLLLLLLLDCCVLVIPIMHGYHDGYSRGDYVLNLVLASTMLENVDSLLKSTDYNLCTVRSLISGGCVH